MNRITSRLLVGAALALVALAGAEARAAGQAAREREQTRQLNEQQLQMDQGTPVYGSQLMTPQERLQYRDRMHSAKTAEERDKIRREHHAEMQARAKERGVTLPDEPPMMGGGRGMGGPGMGRGMGPGMGMGRGPMGPGSGGTPGSAPGAGSSAVPQQ